MWADGRLVRRACRREAMASSGTGPAAFGPVLVAASEGELRPGAPGTRSSAPRSIDKAWGVRDASERADRPGRPGFPSADVSGARTIVLF